mmetsp:Transcript_10176/g.18575  ORF Transcript_10176/g.18575 Transcript_10176/m.18575 type:complete len:216 (+) Transcript_10176:2366-3013(+)
MTTPSFPEGAMTSRRIIVLLPRSDEEVPPDLTAVYSDIVRGRTLALMRESTSMLMRVLLEFSLSLSLLMSLSLFATLSKEGELCSIALLYDVVVVVVVGFSHSSSSFDRMLGGESSFPGGSANDPSRLFSLRRSKIRTNDAAATVPPQTSTTITYAIALSLSPSPSLGGSPAGGFRASTVVPSSPASIGISGRGGSSTATSASAARVNRTDRTSS